MLPLCDRACIDCPFVNICDFAGRSDGRYLCPGNFHCRVDGDALEYINNCSFSRSKFYSFNLSRSEIEFLLDWVMDVEDCGVKYVDLPRLVPIVSLENRDFIKFLDDLDVGAVIVPFTDLLRPRVFDEVVGLGVHGFLRFDGKVILSSIMPDKLIVSRDVWDLFFHAALVGGFDAVIGWDVPVYFDMPLYYCWVNLVKGLELTYWLHRLDLPVIALVKGNTPNQVKFSLDALQRMGFKNYALHASEYLMRFKFDPYARNILYKIAGEVDGWIESLLVLGVLRPESLRFICDVFMGVENLSFGGFSYYLDAKAFRLYLDEGVVDVSSRFLDCRCPICSRSNFRDLIEDVGLRAAHNLYQLKSMLDGGFMYEGELYDLIVGEGETALLISDVHGWTVESRFDDFIDFIRKISPTHLVLLGDIFDFKYGDPSTSQLDSLFNLLGEVNCTVHLAEGCCDGELNSLLRILDKLVFRGRHKSLASIEDELDSRILIEFYKLYRSAKSELTIKLPDNSVLVALHGHRLTLNPAEKLSVVKSLMLEYKASIDADWIVIGHIHRAFIDHENGLASTGCWQLPPRRLQRTVSREDLFKAILVDGDGNLSLIGERVGAV